MAVYAPLAAALAASQNGNGGNGANTQADSRPRRTRRTASDNRGRTVVNGGLRDEYLKKNPNIPTISSSELPTANQTVYDLQQRKKELESERSRNARYSLNDGVLTNNNTDYDAQIADIDKRIAETKKQDDYRSVWDKLVDTAIGAISGSAASKSDAMRALYEKGQNSRTAEYERDIAQLQKDYDRAKRDYEETLELEGEDAAQWAKNTLDDVERKLNAYKKVVDDNVQQKATTATAELADQLQQDSAEKIERAKDGSGAVGRFAVDAGVAATQMGIDALTGRALGLGAFGSSASMGARAFGGGTQQARQGGGDIIQQLGYGAASAAVELLTEKLSDGLAGLYGKGKADDVVEKLIGKLAKTDEGRTALRMIAGGIGEGSEELISDAVNPILRTIYNGQSIGESYSEEQIADWGYDFLVGAVLGVGGSAVNIANGENAKKNAALRGAETEAQAKATAETQARQQAEAETQANATRAVLDDILSRGRVNQQQAAQIMNSPEFARMFEALTGRKLEGSTNQQRTEIQQAAREYAYNKGEQAQQAAAERQTADQTQTEAERALSEYSQQEAARDAEWAERRQQMENYDSYDSYVRGLIRDGMTPAEAGEIARNPQMREAWERLTGQKLPTDSTSRARQMIMETRADVPMPQNQAPVTPQNSVQTQGDISTPPATSNDVVARSQELNSAPTADAMVQNAEAPKNTAPNGTERRPMSMEDYADSNSPVWNNLAYDDTASQQKAMKEAHDRMVTEGKVVEVPESTIQKTAESFPDLRGMKKAERTPILKQKMSEVKTSLRQFLSGIKGGNFEFEVNGNVLEAKLYDTGIKEVLEKITQDKANMLSQSDQIFKNAEYLYSLPDYEGNSEIYRWNYFYTPVKIGDSTVGVRIAVRDMVNPAESQIYNWGIKKTPTLDGTGDGVSRNPGDVSSVGGIDASLDGARPLPDTGSNPSGVSSDASEVSTSDTSIPTPRQNVNSGQEGNSGNAEQRAESNLGSKSGKAKTSQAVETLMEADITPEARQEQLNPYIKNGRFDYIPDTNKAQASRATKKIADVGWKQSVDDFHDAVIKGQSGKDLVAEGAVLLNNAANSDASGQTYLNLASDFIELAHRAGETLQAIKLVQQLSPEGRLYLMSKTVQDINKNLTKGQRKAIAKKELGAEYDEKAFKKAAKEDIKSLDRYGVKIDEEFADKYLNAKTEAERDALISELQKDIAKQMPSTFGEKFNAFRYTAMLGNFKTQKRNVIGNTSSLVTKMVKDRIAAGVEGIGYVVSGGKMERTRSAWAGGKLYKEAAADFTAHKSEALGEAKYTSVGEKASKEIEDNRTIFKVNGTWGTDDASHPFARSIAAKTARKAADTGMAVLEGWRKGTNWAMEAGDAIFARAAYADAMAGWLKAHKINSFAEATEAQLDKARQFAAREAQEATFRDTNMVSEFVTELGSGWRESNNALARGASKVLDATIPFRKTPANVAVRAVEYSPLGIIETAVKAFEAAKGNVNAAEVINSACKNATGAAIFVAGYFMKMGGKLRGKEDDEELDKAQKATGAMDYSYITNSGKSISLSQFAPVSIPLFMGVRLRELTEDGFQLKDLWPILKGTTSPMLDQSMMQGLNESLAGLASYGDDQDAIGQFIENALLSYASQYVPSIVRQFEQAWEKNRQSTYTDKNAPILTTDAQYTIGKISAGVPGWDYNQSDYIDMWGRKTSQGNAVKRYYNAFLNPVYTSESKREPLDDELERLHKAGKDIDGFPSVYPDSGSKYIDLDGKGTQMTQEQFDSYRIERGTKSRELAKEFVESDEYKLMSDTQRAEVLRDLYSLAADRALKTVKTSNGIAYSGNLDDIAKLKDIPEYYSTKQILNDAKDKTKANFDAVDQVLKNFGLLKDDTQALLRDSGLHVDQLLYADKKGVSSEDWFDIYEGIKAYRRESGNSNDRSAAIAINNIVDGTDEEKLKALEAQLTPNSADASKNPGKRNAVVRRYEAAINSGVSYDNWTKVEEALDEVAPGKTPNRNEVYEAAAMAKAGVSGSTAYWIYNKYSSDKSKVEQYDYSYGAESDADSTSNTGTSKSSSARSAEEYFRALGLLK